MGLQQIYKEFVHHFGDRRPLSIISSSQPERWLSVPYLGLPHALGGVCQFLGWRSRTLLGPLPRHVFPVWQGCLSGWSSAVCGPPGPQVGAARQEAAPPAPSSRLHVLAPSPALQPREQGGTWGSRRRVSIESQGALVAHRHRPPHVLSVFVDSLCWIMEVPVERSFSKCFYHRCLPCEF